MRGEINNSLKGFSLVELSIVLVILGLLTGGILSGQALIRAAELRSLISEAESFKVAGKSFKDRYLALPGDIANATSFWGAEDSDHSTCITTSSSTKTTCNGDGNGNIGTGGPTDAHERFRAWQHMANAGLINGEYTGVGTGTAQEATSVNVPGAKLSGGLWYIVYRNLASTNSTAFKGDYGNSLYVGRYFASYGPGTGLITPEEAWVIDNKIDDSKPALGFIRPIGVAACTDYTSGDAEADVKYLQNSTDETCVISFLKSL